MAAAAIMLSFALIDLDHWLGSDAVQEVRYLYLFGPEGARAIMSTIASSMMTVASLTFSITMLTLQLASSQYGPRLLRNFMRDRGNQIVLGTFIATFVYCLLVLRTIRGVEGSSFVPHVAVAFGVLLALLSLAVLIYFIHHVASSIRIESLLTELAIDTRKTIDRLFPEELGVGPADRDTHAQLPADFAVEGQSVLAGASGYVQRIDLEALMQCAVENDLILAVEARPGCFVTDIDPLFRVLTQRQLSDDVTGRLLGCIVVGAERTPEQDLAFSVRRIVEIAQRALSPGINDPTTALYCIDRLQEAFVHLARRDIPSGLRCDAAGRLRVVTEVAVLDNLASDAFAAVARYGLKDVDVVARLLDAINRIVRAMPASQGTRLRMLAEQMRSAGQGDCVLPRDLERLEGLQGPARPQLS
jgi:uncharacterized membrane protein